MILESLGTKDDQRIRLGEFTILVGPNNVGKTQTLRDIRNLMDEDGAVSTGESLIISELGYSQPDSFDDLIAGIPMNIDKNASSHGLHVPPRISLSKDTSYSGLSTGLNTLETWKEQFEVGNATHERFSQWKVLFLNSESRLTACDTTEFQYEPFLGNAGTLHHALLDDESGKEADLRDAFRKTFGMDIALDYSGMKELCFRIGDSFEDLPDHPRELYDAIHDYPKLDEQGEGYRSFTSIVLSLLFSEGRVVLLDEPEAYLHPEQARTLGNWMVEHSESIPGQVIIATHNANILSGILDKTQNVVICRLNRSGDSTFYHRMPDEVVAELRKDPLLSTQGILQSIFQMGVVVCEGDSDNIIYRSVASAELDNSELLFIHAHDKTRIDRVSRLLHSGNIPVAVIVDIDILKDDTFEDILGALGGHSDTDEFSRRRERIDEEIRSIPNGWKEVEDNGINGAPENIRADLRALLQDAKDFGLFTVPVGEVEDWFGLGKNRSSAGMAIEAVERIEASEISEELIRFIEEVESYLSQKYTRRPQNDC